jgi:hypothetical protein
MKSVGLTTKFGQDIIIQEVNILGDDNVIKCFMREIFQLKEEHLRAALVKLGWTPPLHERN